MSEVTIRANSRVLGYRRGETAKIELTRYVQTLVDAKRLSIVDEDQAEPAQADQPKRRRRAEKDADGEDQGGE